MTTANPTGTDDSLFPLPTKHLPHRKPFQKTQRYTCKRCKGSVHDSDGAYCHRFDLCIDWSDGVAILCKNGLPLKCDGKEWSY